MTAEAMLAKSLVGEAVAHAVYATLGLGRLSRRRGWRVWWMRSPRLRRGGGGRSCRGHGGGGDGGGIRASGGGGEAGGDSASGEPAGGAQRRRRREELASRREAQAQAKAEEEERKLEEQRQKKAAEEERRRRLLEQQPGGEFGFAHKGLEPQTDEGARRELHNAMISAHYLDFPGQRLTELSHIFRREAAAPNSGPSVAQTPTDPELMPLGLPATSILTGAVAPPVRPVTAAPDPFDRPESQVHAIWGRPRMPDPALIPASVPEPLEAAIAEQTHHSRPKTIAGGSAWSYIGRRFERARRARQSMRRRWPSLRPRRPEAEAWRNGSRRDRRGSGRQAQQRSVAPRKGGEEEEALERPLLLPLHRRCWGANGSAIAGRRGSGSHARLRWFSELGGHRRRRIRRRGRRGGGGGGGADDVTHAVQGGGVAGSAGAVPASDGSGGSGVAAKARPVSPPRPLSATRKAVVPADSLLPAGPRPASRDHNRSALRHPYSSGAPASSTAGGMRLANGLLRRRRHAAAARGQHPAQWQWQPLAHGWSRRQIIVGDGGDGGGGRAPDAGRPCGGGGGPAAAHVGSSDRADGGGPRGGDRVAAVG